jgi:hypothetical protein
MEKQKLQIPAGMIFQTTGELPPIEINWLHIMQTCKDGLTQGAKYVILPVEVSQDYKPQRRRLITDDKKSPRGLIQRDSKATRMYYPHAAAKFDIEELGSYAAERFDSISAADLKRMSEEFIGSSK